MAGLARLACQRESEVWRLIVEALAVPKPACLCVSTSCAQQTWSADILNGGLGGCVYVLYTTNLRIGFLNFRCRLLL